MTAKHNELLDHLAACIQDDRYIFPPTYDLPKPIYGRLKLMLEGIGGRWDTKAKAFQFKSDPSQLLERVRQGESINLERAFKKRTQYFPTPETVIELMAELIYISRDCRVLEPSAGQGAICDYFTSQYISYPWQLDVCELEPANRMVLLDKGYNVVGEDFTEMDFPESGYHLIIANPPFAKEQDIQHVMRMYQLLAPGGRLVSVMSAGSLRSLTKLGKTFSQYFLEDFHNLIDVPKNSFSSSGTAIDTVIFSCDKPIEDPYIRPVQDNCTLGDTMALF